RNGTPDSALAPAWQPARAWVASGSCRTPTERPPMHAVQPGKVSPWISPVSTPREWQASAGTEAPPPRLSMVTYLELLRAMLPAAVIEDGDLSSDMIALITCC